jgi:predicted tellurium resistance membrane protein TerC
MTYKDVAVNPLKIKIPDKKARQAALRGGIKGLIIIIIIIIINHKWVDTRWQWLFHILHMHGLLR